MPTVTFGRAVRSVIGIVLVGWIAQTAISAIRATYNTAIGR